MAKGLKGDRYLGNMAGVAFITGAASGIGRCCAMAFARLGTKVVLVDLNLQGLERIQQELLEWLPAPDILVRQLDVRDASAVADLVSGIPKLMGGLHFAINCSGILGPDYDSDIANHPDENWSLVLDINLKAPAIITKQVVRVMLQQNPLPSFLEEQGMRPPKACQRRGVIINMGSSASLRARSSAGSPYIASKHGLVGLTKSTAVSYGAQGIKCNILTPGFVRTPLISSMLGKVAEVAANVPMRRVAEPEEIADMVVFLCSERASYVNGVVLPLDGGWSCL